MSKRSLILTLVLVALPAAAEAQNNPIGAVFARSQLGLEEQRINIADVVENTAVIRLNWTVTGLNPGAWDYELTYGSITETSTAPPQVRVEPSLGFEEAQGDQPIGTLLQVELQVRNVVALDSELPIALGGTGRDNYDQAICVNVYPDSNRDFNQTGSECWTFDVDTLAPEPPTLTELVPGENRIVVRWEPNANTNDIRFYQVVYCVNPSDPEALCDPSQWRVSDQLLADQESETAITDGIRVGDLVVVGVRSIDDFQNFGEPSNVLSETSVEVDDFLELYEGTEDGGFCFVATAAFGSYAHPAVRVLRTFRDRVLHATPVGSALVWTYYRYGPPFARTIAAHPDRAAWVRLWLIPVAVFGLAAVVVPLLAWGWFFGLVLWRARRRLAGWLVAGSVLLVASEVSAEPRPESAYETFGFGIELKGGPYSMALVEDEQFQRVFDSSSRPLFEFGFDVQVYRGFGTVVVGGTIGYLRYSGNALFGKDSDRPGEVSEDPNVFNVMPLTLQVGYRFDWLADQTWVPLVPYVKGGLAYSFWWATNGVGNLQRRRDQDSTEQAVNLVGRGGKIGYVGTLGVAFMLNKIDYRVAQSLFADTSVRGTYVLFEMVASQVDDFGDDGFDLSDTTWRVGLYLEF